MALRYHPRMPLIRCAKCGQTYDVPGVIAVRLPNSIATCQCGEWLSGSKAALKRLRPILGKLAGLEACVPLRTSGVHFHRVPL